MKKLLTIKEGARKLLLFDQVRLLVLNTAHAASGNRPIRSIFQLVS